MTGQLLRAMACAALLAVSATPVMALPSFAEVKAAYRPSDVRILDREGLPIQTVRIDKTVRRLAWIPLEDISPALLQAIVLSEDRRFYEHSGVDWSAVARSAWANVWNKRTSGASTLTMQLAGLIDDDLTRPGGGRSVGQKLSQILTARQLDASWKKSQILEAYLNLVAFRGEMVGVDALTQTLFDKFASGLDQQESAITAALLRGPNASPALVARRACGLLKHQGAGCLGVDVVTEAALQRKPGMPLGEQLAPHFARQLELKAGTAAIRTSLDARLQRLAVASLRGQLRELLGRNVEDGAVVVLDNRSGEVLAWVGSSGPLSEARQVDAVLARRQPGSTLKPFIYGLAFERRLITPASLLDDSPAQLATSSGVYAPQNYDRDFKGWVSARTALGASLNVPAVRVAAMLPPDILFNRLNEFGLDLAESGGYHGYALALGAADVTLLALTNAYRSLANGGVVSDVTLLARNAGKSSLRAAPGRRVADAAAVHLVTDILADNNARLLTFGFDSSLATRGFAAVKTGTSKDMRDNWCIGFTDRYTVGVWVGNASGEAMHDISGISGAAPVWRTIVQALHRQRASQAPARPAGVVATPIRYQAGYGSSADGVEAARTELFLAGTEQAIVRGGSQVAAPGRQAVEFGIHRPRDGSIFALDPDIPPRSQRIVFEGEAGTWLLDGRVIGKGRTVDWAPWPGRHQLSLRGQGGRIVQTVQFEVRGAGVKAVGLQGPRVR